MLRIALLCVAISGLHAAPLELRVSHVEGLAGEFRHSEEPSPRLLPDDYRQGTEPMRRFLVDLNSGQVLEHISEMERRASPVGARSDVVKSSGQIERHWLDEVEIPIQRSGAGWVRVERHFEDQIPKGFRQGTQSRMSMATEPMASIPDGFRQGTEPMASIPDGFRQGTEPMASIPDGFRQGTEPMASIPDGFRQGTEPMASIPSGFRQGTEPMASIPDGFRQGTEPMASIPSGFRQRIEPMASIPDGFRQGTEPMASIPDGFRQGTEPMASIPDGFRQGTEPMASIPDGFRQGTEPMASIPDGFRQGTEPMASIPSGFRQGTEPILSIPEGFRQGTELSNVWLDKQEPACDGKIIMGRCYQFNPKPLSFKDAQSVCRGLAPNSNLASVTDEVLHSGLVSMVTKEGKASPVLTWLGGVVKNQRAQWVDGSEWGYSDWMRGHPKIDSVKPVCLEMFRIDEIWWTTVDCELLRASICSYPVTA